jgi:hypothetical protein
VSGRILYVGRRDKLFQIPRTKAETGNCASCNHVYVRALFDIFFHPDIPRRLRSCQSPDQTRSLAQTYPTIADPGRANSGLNRLRNPPRTSEGDRAIGRGMAIIVDGDEAQAQIHQHLIVDHIGQGGDLP